jgi:hypothetical protein
MMADELKILLIATILRSQIFFLKMRSAERRGLAQKILILPKGHGVSVAELPLEPDEKPAEAEEQVSRFLHVCAPPHSRKLKFIFLLTVCARWKGGPRDWMSMRVNCPRGGGGAYLRIRRRAGQDMVLEL